MAWLSNRLARRTRVVIVAAVVASLAGCGSDDDRSGRNPGASPSAPHLTLTEAESVIEAGKLAVVRTGLREGAVLDVQPAPVESARYESQSGREFDVAVFSSPAAARAAWPSAVDAAESQETGSAVRAANVVAVFPKPFPEVDAYRAVARALRGVATACRPAEDAEADAEHARLRALCFGDVAKIPPAGTGVDEDAAPIGGSVTVAGIEYTPQIARQLNPLIKRDSEFVGGRRAPDGKTWFAVFLRACNVTDRAHMTTSDLQLVGAFGTAIAPQPLAPGNPYAHEPARLRAGECLPKQGSVADRAADGSLVAFLVPNDFLAERPVGLAVGTGVARRIVELDL